MDAGQGGECMGVGCSAASSKGAVLQGRDDHTQAPATVTWWTSTLMGGLWSWS